MENEELLRRLYETILWITEIKLLRSRLDDVLYYLYFHRLEAKQRVVIFSAPKSFCATTVFLFYMEQFLLCMSFEQKWMIWLQQELQERVLFCKARQKNKNATSRELPDSPKFVFGKTRIFFI